MADIELRHTNNSKEGVLGHSFEISMGLLFLLSGIALIQTKFHVHLTVTQEAPRVLVASWAASLLAGGAAVITGLLWPGEGRTARAIEVAGLWLSTSAWLTYLICLLAVAPDAQLLSFGQPLAVVFGCIGRLWTLHRVTRALVRLGHALSQHSDTDEETET